MSQLPPGSPQPLPFVLGRSGPTGLPDPALVSPGIAFYKNVSACAFRSRKKKQTDVGVAAKWPNKASEKIPSEGNQSSQSALVASRITAFCSKEKTVMGSILPNVSIALKNAPAVVLQLHLLTSSHKTSKTSVKYLIGQTGRV